MPQTMAERNERLRKQREIMLKLAKLNKEMRDSVVHKMRQEHLEPIKLANRLRSKYGSNPQDTVSAILGTRIIGAGKMLSAFADYTDKHRLADDIRALVGQIPADPQMGLAVFPNSVIMLAFDIQTAYAGMDAEEQTSIEHFSSVFGENAAVVEGVLKNWRAEALRTLNEKPTVASEILDQLADTEKLVADVKSVRDAERAKLELKVQEFQVLFGELAPLYDDLDQAAQAMGCNKKQRPSLAYVEEMLQSVQRLLSENADRKAADQGKQKGSRSKKNGTTTVQRPKAVEDSASRFTIELAEPAKSKTQPPPAPQPVNVTETGRVQLEECFGLLNILLNGLRVSVSAVIDLTRIASINLRPRDRLELARIVVKLSELGKLDQDALEEACGGKPIEDFPAVMKSLSYLFGETGARKGSHQ